MNTFVYQICQYIADNSTLFTFGDGDTSLKVGELERGKQGVFAVGTPSEAPDRYTAVEYQTVDFWSLYKNSAEAYSQLQEIYSLLHQSHHYVLESYMVFFSHASTNIMDMDRDSENRKMLKISVRFIIGTIIS